MIKAVLLDMDGTVLDTERINKFCWEKAMSDMGIAFEPETFYDLVGLNEESTERYFAEVYGFSHQQFLKMSSAAYDYSRQYKKDNGTPVKKGFIQLSDYLRSNKLLTAAVTSSKHSEALHNFQSAGIQDRFDVIIGGDNVANGKPSPEPYLKAAEALGVFPSECIAAEDSANGVLSAHAAGMKCVYIKDMIHIPDEVRQLAEYKADSLDEITGIIGDLNRYNKKTEPQS